MLIEELYDALIEAGASQDKARAASRAVADMEKHFGDIEKEILSLRSEVEREFSEFRGNVEREFSEFRGNVEREFSEFRGNVEREFSEFRGNVEREFTDIRGTLRLHNWMMGSILAFLIAVFFKVFTR